MISTKSTFPSIHLISSGEKKGSSFESTIAGIPKTNLVGFLYFPVKVTSRWQPSSVLYWYFHESQEISSRMRYCAVPVVSRDSKFHTLAILECFPRLSASAVLPSLVFPQIQSDLTLSRPPGCRSLILWMNSWILSGTLTNEVMSKTGWHTLDSACFSSKWYSASFLMFWNERAVCHPPCSSAASMNSRVLFDSSRICFGVFLMGTWKVLRKSPSLTQYWMTFLGERADCALQWCPWKSNALADRMSMGAGKRRKTWKCGVPSAWASLATRTSWGFVLEAWCSHESLKWSKICWS